MPKLTPEERAAREKRDREFRALLERRREVDAKLQAEREAKEQSQQQ
jgi:hypothetical protein